MIDTTAALEILAQHTIDFGTEEIALSDSLNRVLKENWSSDRDLPPYDRVTMDGIAINFQSYAKGIRSFPVEGIAAAGMEQQHLQNAQNCLEVMTGAVLPLNSNTVIRYEDLSIENGIARINVNTIKQQQNVHFKGEDRKANTIVIPTNTSISTAEIGVGASLGKSRVKVAKLPKVMVISTGDELVGIEEQPKAHQIRRSNVYRLLTSLKAHKISADDTHLNDDPKEIRAQLATFLTTYDVIILSGGVSKGKFDYVPEILAELGVTKLFHRVKQRPGKPFWFGQYKKTCTIFALPGNPTSSFLCTQRYFLPWLHHTQTGRFPKVPHAILAQAVEFKPYLTYFLEVKLDYNEKGQILATPIKGNGSGDIANPVNADAFIELPSGKNLFQIGEIYPIYKYR